MLPRNVRLIDALILSLASITPTTAAPTLSESTRQWQIEVNSIPEDWQKYVRAPPSSTISPVSVVSRHTRGSVVNPDGLLTPGGDPTVLTRSRESTAASSDVTPEILVDFGQNVAGYLSINFADAATSGDGLPGIRLAFSESLQYGYLSNVSDFTRSYNGDTITPGSDQIAVQSGPYTWTDTHGCEYNDAQVCADGIHGFRYLKIYLDALEADAPHTSSYGQVAIDSLSLNYTAFLGTPDTFTGWFESSDDDLNQWYYDAVYTNDLCADTLDANSTDPRDAASPSTLGKLMLLDGPKRDRLPYIGDLAVSGRTWFLTRDAPEAVSNVLADLGDHQREDGWIPPASINNYTLKLLDYPLWWIVNSYDLLLYTGDADYFDLRYQIMVNTLDDFFPSVTSPLTQLITKGFGVSGSYGDYAFLSRTGAVTYFNALYVLALDSAASIAKFLGGHDDDALRWSARAEVVRAAININLFDNDAGAFFDGICGFNPCKTHAQDGNALSIVSGTASGEKAESILSYLSQNMARPYGNAFYDNDLIGQGFSNRVYAFISYFELEARFITGLAESGLEEIRRLYGWMASNDPGITQWEGIGADGLPYEGDFTSLSHGWSTGIVPILTNYVLGVIPTGPGFSTWSIRPQPGDVRWARGQVPTPVGMIHVYWNQNRALDLFFLSASAPMGTSGNVSVPVSNHTTPVYIQSELVWGGGESNSYDARYDDGHVSFKVEGGEYNITVGYSGK